MTAQTASAQYDALLTIKDVMQITRLGSSTIYRRIDEGAFPRARKLSEKCVRWRQSDINHWIKSLPET